LIVTFEGLTATEARVAGLLARGFANAEVTAELAISEQTLEHRLADVYRKLGVRSRTELAFLLGADAGVQRFSQHAKREGSEQ